MPPLYGRRTAHRFLLCESGYRFVGAEDVLEGDCVRRRLQAGEVKLRELVHVFDDPTEFGLQTSHFVLVKVQARKARDVLDFFPGDHDGLDYSQKKMGALVGAREEKGEFEWETLIVHIGDYAHCFSPSNKKPRRSGALVSARDLSLLGSNGRNVCRLKALRALNYVESNSLSLR